MLAGALQSPLRAVRVCAPAGASAIAPSRNRSWIAPRRAQPASRDAGECASCAAAALAAPASCSTASRRIWLSTDAGQMAPLRSRASKFGQRVGRIAQPPELLAQEFGGQRAIRSASQRLVGVLRPPRYRRRRSSASPAASLRARPHARDRLLRNRSGRVRDTDGPTLSRSGSCVRQTRSPDEPRLKSTARLPKRRISVPVALLRHRVDRARPAPAPADCARMRRRTRRRRRALSGAMPCASAGSSTAASLTT